MCYDAWWSLIASSIVLATGSINPYRETPDATGSGISKARVDQVVQYQSRLVELTFIVEKDDRISPGNVLQQSISVAPFPSCIIGPCDCDAYIASVSSGENVGCSVNTRNGS